MGMTMGDTWVKSIKSDIDERKKGRQFSAENK